MKRIHKEHIVILLFFLLIGTAYLSWGILSPYVDTENYEKREAAKRPEFNIMTANTFHYDYESYINDNLPFRNQMIRLDNMIKYYIFRSSSTDRVAIGKDNWLFYTKRDDGDPIGCYKGTNLLSEQELALIEQNLTEVRDELADRGIEFVLFIAPNKERIYSSYMPWYYGEPAENYAVQQIVDYLKKNTDIRVVYPIDELMKAVNYYGDRALLYHKTDTHWNELGAYVGTRELLKELGVILPPYDAGNMTVNAYRDESGDLASMLNMSSILSAGETYGISGYDVHHYINDEWDYDSVFRYHAEGADPRKIFMKRDSFGAAMAELVGSQFDNSIIVNGSIYDRDMVAEETPDIYVYEVVERYARGWLQDKKQIY